MWVLLYETQNFWCLIDLLSCINTLLFNLYFIKSAVVTPMTYLKTWRLISVKNVQRASLCTTFEKILEIAVFSSQLFAELSRINFSSSKYNELRPQLSPLSPIATPRGSICYVFFCLTSVRFSIFNCVIVFIVIIWGFICIELEAFRLLFWFVVSLQNYC